MGGTCSGGRHGARHESDGERRSGACTSTRPRWQERTGRALAGALTNLSVPGQVGGGHEEPRRRAQMPYAPVAQPQDGPAQPGGLESARPDRLAQVLRRLRWPVLITWLAIAVVLYPVAHSLPSVVNNSAAAELQPSAPSTRALVLQQTAERAQADV